MLGEKSVEATGSNKELKIGLKEGVLGDPGGYRWVNAITARPFEGAFDMAMVTKAFVMIDLGGADFNFEL